MQLNELQCLQPEVDRFVSKDYFKRMQSMFMNLKLFKSSISSVWVINNNCQKYLVTIIEF